MNDYAELIRLLKEAKDLYAQNKSPLVPINVALIQLIALESEQNYQANKMGEDYWKEFENNTGTLRSTINDLDKLSGGELKSTWNRK